MITYKRAILDSELEQILTIQQRSVSSSISEKSVSFLTQPNLHYGDQWHPRDQY
jgi:hypothetical protein